MEHTKLEVQQQPFSQSEVTSDSTSPQQSDISPGVYPEPLQTTVSSDPRSRSQSRSPPLRKPVAGNLPADLSATPSPGHERMPSVNSLPPKEGQFGVVSSSGQLVCEFRPASTVADGTPKLPPKTSEEYITSATFASPGHRPATDPTSPPLGPNTLSSSPPPGPTVSTLELAVDYNNYPEVYVPEQQQHQQEEEQPPSLPPRVGSPGSPPIPRKSLPMDNTVESPPAPAYSTPADYQRIGYTGTLDMSTAVATVTPLHMLGDQPDMVDCPFCMRRVETSVKKRASSRTQ